MKTATRFILYFAAGLFAYNVVTILFFWFQNPGLTQMELLFEKRLTFIACLALAIAILASSTTINKITGD